LAKVVADELRVLSRSKLGAIVDPAAGPRLLRAWELSTNDRDLLAEMLIAGGRHVEQELARQQGSLRDLLGRELAGDVDALLDTERTLPPYAGEFAAGLMQQEFVQRLLTDLIFTAIAGFNRRVNPLFGAATTHMLEDQIKGFIRLFMPTLQQQAVAFVTSRTNQRVALDFGRAIFRQLFDESLARHATLLSGANRQQAEAVLRKALHSGRFDAALRRAGIVLWEDVYAHLRHKKIADLVELDRHAAWLTDRIQDALAIALARPGVAQLLAEEVALASARK